MPSVERVARLRAAYARQRGGDAPVDGEMGPDDEGDLPCDED